MSLLVLSARDLRELLPMADCIDVVDAALRRLAQGEAVLPLRTLMRLPADKGLLGMMPAQLGGAGGDHAIKVVSVFPGNHGTGIDAHQGAVLLFEGRHGRLVAVLDASELTAIRTAAASAVATRALARADAASLAIVGTGVEARTHLEAGSRPAATSTRSARACRPRASSTARRSRGRGSTPTGASRCCTRPATSCSASRTA